MVKFILITLICILATSIAKVHTKTSIKDLYGFKWQGVESYRAEWKQIDGGLKWVSVGITHLILIF
jgi:hypothetical protein